MSIEQGKTVVLVLLDLSAAFDTIDHGVLFSRLEKLFGLSGSVLDWFMSYLKERSQRVSIQGVLGSHKVLFLVLHYSQCIQNHLVPLHSGME